MSQSLLPTSPSISCSTSLVTRISCNLTQTPTMWSTNQDGAQKHCADSKDQKGPG